MNEELLDHCVSLRKRGVDSTEIERRLKAKDLSDTEIKYLLKESDDLFISNQIQKYEEDLDKIKTDYNPLRVVFLIVALIFLLLVFFGYIYVGLPLLILLWYFIMRRGRATRQWSRKYFDR